MLGERSTESISLTRPGTKYLKARPPFSCSTGDCSEHRNFMEYMSRAVRSRPSTCSPSASGTQRGLSLCSFSLLVPDGCYHKGSWHTGRPSSQCAQHADKLESFVVLNLDVEFSGLTNTNDASTMQASHAQNKSMTPDKLSRLRRDILTVEWMSNQATASSIAEISVYCCKYNVLRACSRELRLGKKSPVDNIPYEALYVKFPF